MEIVSISGLTDNIPSARYHKCAAVDSSSYDSSFLLLSFNEENHFSQKNLQRIPDSFSHTHELMFGATQCSEMPV